MSPTSQVAIPSRLPTLLRKMQPFKDHPSTCGHLPGCRKKPGYKQTAESLAMVHTWIVILCVQLSNISNKCVLVCVPIGWFWVNLVKYICAYAYTGTDPGGGWSG